MNFNRQFHQKVIVAMDSFKGCLTSCEANAAAAEGFRRRHHQADVVLIPVSDGGEGWLDAFHHAIGGVMIELTVFDPLMRPVRAHYLLNEDTAVIEISQACGLSFLTKKERNPMIATSYGVGQLIADAAERGCTNIIVGLGGSATSDCGIGMLKALVDGFAKGGTWDDVHVFDDIRFTIAADVANPLCGPDGAAHVFAPQKGATPQMVSLLDARATRFADASARHFGHDCRNNAAAGAAGGLGYAFLQYLNACSRSGTELLLDIIHFNQLLDDTLLVITGEGAADKQTLMGKLPYGILQAAKKKNVPVYLFAGQVNDKELLMEAGFAGVDSITPVGMPLKKAMKRDVALKNLAGKTGEADFAINDK